MASKVEPFKALYYPNDVSSLRTFQKAILIFDELYFYDHTSITFGDKGTVGHDSAMRSVIEPAKKEGYTIQVLKPYGGQVEHDLKEIINADLTNQKFRDTFMQLVRNDPTFILTKVADGNYGKYGDANAYRKRIMSLRDDEIPRSVDEIAQAHLDDGIPPEIDIAMIMGLDSFNLNFSGLAALDNNLQLFGDSVGMDMMLKAKFAGDSRFEAADKGISQAVAFALLEYLVPDSAFNGKSPKDIMQFRNEMAKERDQFKEHILSMTIELADLSGAAKEKKVKEILYKYLIPETKNFQNAMAKRWDKMFADSLKALVYNSDDIIKQVTTVLPLSVAASITAAAVGIGKTVVPHIIDYVSDRRDLERSNPYSYLMRLNK